MKNWYALHTKVRRERSVSLLLRQRGIEVFMPYVSPQSAGGVSSPVAFFPGYLFARLDLKQEEAGWRWTPGLKKVVAYGDEPIPIPDEIIDFIARHVARITEDEELFRHGFQPGDEVRIKEGPFRDMVALFEGPTTPSERVQVLLSTMNRSVRLRLLGSNLEIVTRGGRVPSSRRRRTRGRGRRIRYKEHSASLS